jgi:ubiquinone/menaquinone biosynthesis C-methylase UbiE
MPDITPTPIFQVATGFMAAKQLFIAGEIGLFEHLAGSPATLEELADRTGIHSRPLRIVADAMVALGFVQKDGAFYQNGPVAGAFLAGTGPADLRPALRYWNRLNYPRWMKFEDAVRTDEAVFGDFAFSAEEQKLYSEGVEAITSGTAAALAREYNFSRHQHVMDVGGGTGTFLLSVLRQHSALDATLLDLPAVAALAQQRLAQHPLAGRMRIVGADFFHDPIPDGHNVALLVNIVHNFSPEKNQTLLRKLRAAMPAGARLLLVDFWTDPTHTQPIFAALMAGSFLLVSGEGRVYSADEGRDWLNATGWKLLDHRPLAGPASLLVAEAAD